MIRLLISIAAFLAAAAPNATASSNSDIWRRKPAGLVAGWDFSGGRLTGPQGHVVTLFGNSVIPSGQRYLALDSNDYVTVADANEFSFTSAGQDLPWSFSGWIKLDALTSQQYVMIKGPEYQLTIGSATDGNKGLTLILYKSDYSASIGATQGSAAGFTTGTWHHIGCSYTGSESWTGISLIFNGHPVSASSANSGTYTGTANTTQVVRFGYAGGSIQNGGSLTDIRIYNRALTTAEFAQIYNRGKSTGGTP